MEGFARRRFALESSGLVKIAEVILASATTPTFSDIPQNFRHLLLTSEARSAGGGTSYEWLKLASFQNSISSVGITYQYNGSTFVASGQNLAYFFGGLAPQSNVAAGIYGYNELWFPNYSRTDREHELRGTFNGIYGTTGSAATASLFYFATTINYSGAPITMIQYGLTTASHNLAAGSIFTLYGMP